MPREPKPSTEFTDEENADFSEIFQKEGTQRNDALKDLSREERTRYAQWNSLRNQFIKLLKTQQLLSKIEEKLEKLTLELATLAHIDTPHPNTALCVMQPTNHHADPSASATARTILHFPRRRAC